MSFTIELDNNQCGVISPALYMMSLLFSAYIIYVSTSMISSRMSMSFVSIRDTDYLINKSDKTNEQNESNGLNQSDELNESDGSDELNESDESEESNESEKSKESNEPGELGEFCKILDELEKLVSESDESYEQSSTKTNFNQNTDFNPNTDIYTYTYTHTKRNVNTVSADSEFIVRLEGNDFSDLFGRLRIEEFAESRTPFINEFKHAMEMTTADIIKEFDACVGHTHSNEISLLFKVTDTSEGAHHIYNGNMIKLLTSLSSFASVQLGKHLRNKKLSKFDSVVDKLMFNSEYKIFSDNFEVVNYFVSRSKHEGFKRFVDELSARYFSNESLAQLDTFEKSSKLNSVYNIDVDIYSVFIRYGTFVKRELVRFSYDDQVYSKYNFIRFALPNLTPTEEYYNMLCSKNCELWEYLEFEPELLSRLV